MAIKNYYIDKRVLKDPTINAIVLDDLQNTLNLKTYIESVVDDANTDFSSLNVDTINESTAAHGVIVDGVTLKDNNVTVGTSGAVVTDTVSEKTAAAGVTIDGALVKDSTIALADGTVGNLSVKIGADTNNGFYGVSDTQLGVAVEGALVGFFDANGLNTGYINEQVTTAGVYMEGVHFRDGVFNTYPNFGVAKDVTGVVSAAELSTGYITSTSAAPVSLSFPTATDLYTRLNACPGSMFDVVIDNSGGANTVTVSLDASMAVVTPAITGGDTLTVSTANAVGVFKIVFTSGTTAKIFRIA